MHHWMLLDACVECSLPPSARQHDGAGDKRGLPCLAATAMARTLSLLVVGFERPHSCCCCQDTLLQCRIDRGSPEPPLAQSRVVMHSSARMGIARLAYSWIVLHPLQWWPSARDTSASWRLYPIWGQLSGLKHCCIDVQGFSWGSFHAGTHRRSLWRQLRPACLLALLPMATNLPAKVEFRLFKALMFYPLPRRLMDEVWSLIATLIPTIIDPVALLYSLLWFPQLLTPYC